ncbi:TonB-dependent siderophore receptor [Acinetobacter sp. Tr-809]|uniref:TonB-dependent receptor n=1 Tax=Acinetobacter sp. Tr-809 TaxID=2608324 RepID=UPI001423422A|nr:TonB-dependent siderophore receptor [Acinetobacter sp. Tr-809]NIE95977.1 TonB-dependent siderophore receptor [Acinetobacter sp. Tr-809]
MKNSMPYPSIRISKQRRNDHPQFKLKHLVISQIMLGLGLFPLNSLHAEDLEKIAHTDQNIATLATIQVQADKENQNDLGGQIASQGQIGFLGDKSLRDTPFSVISYTEKYIADRQARDITDVIVATDPSVYSTGAFGVIAESYTIRGFNSSSTPAGKDTAFGGLYGIAPLYRASPEMFERIDVLKGPSAMLNGMPPGGTLGGNVNLVPKRATDTPINRLTTSYMSNAQFGGHLDIGRRFGQNQAFGVRFNGVYRDGEGAIDDQDKKTQLMSLGLDWRGEQARISADLYTSQDQNDGINRGVTLKTGVKVPNPPNPKTLLNPTWTFFDTKDKGLMLRGEYDFNPEWMGYATAGMSKTEYSTLGAAKGEIQNEAGDILFNIAHLGFEYERKSAEVGLRGKFNTGNIGHAISLNATHYREVDDEFGIRQGFKTDRLTNIYQPNWGTKPDRAAVAPIFSNKERLTSYGLADTLSFAQDQLQMTLGIRHQNIVTESLNANGVRNLNGLYDKSAWTPAAAILIKANPHLSFYANYIEGLSSGGVASSNFENYGEIFSPYKTKQKEVGLKFDVENFSSSLSVYEIKTPSGYSTPNQDSSKKPIYSIDGEQRNRGIEWGFWGAPLQGLRVMGGVTYIQPKLTKTQNPDELGNMATGVPKMQAKLGLEGDIDYVPGLTLTANAIAASKQYINRINTISVPSREVYSIGARYSTQIAQFPVTFRGSVENLTNKAYWSMPQFTSLMLGAPRTYLFSASFDF